MNWNEKNINDDIKCATTGLNYHPYKKSFFNWFKKQDKESIARWKHQLFLQRLSDEILEFKEAGWMTDSEIMAYETEKLKSGRSRTVDWLLQDLNDELSQFTDYQSYHDDYYSGFLEEKIKPVEDLLLWKTFKWSFEEKAALCKISERVGSFQSSLNHVETLRRYRAPQIVIDEQQKKVWEAIEKLKVSATEQELQLLSNLYDDYDDFQIPSEYDKNTLEEFNKKATMIKELWKFLLALGAPSQDIYRKNRRLPGSGWSNQK